MVYKYTYANNNPYLYIDPDGREAEIVYNKNGSLTINIPINFSGDGATSSNIQSIKSDISSRWSGNYTINGVVTNVQVNVTTPKTNGVSNNIVLTNGPTSNKRCGGCSYVRGGASGEWDTTSSGMQYGEAAHEAGHLMGIGDKYSSKYDAKGNRTGTSPHYGYKGNIMAELPGKPSDDNMKDILSSKRNKKIK